MTLNDATNISTIIGSLAIIGIFIQVLLAYRQLKADHERSRREKSVEMLLEWNKQLKEDSSLARKIAESLNEEQSRKLFNQEIVEIDSKFKPSLMKLFGITDEKLLDENNSKVKLDEGQVSKLRWHLITYLNSLESILVAWQYSIVDREIIEHQFSYLISPEKGHSALKYFRTATGGEKTYPAIELFSRHLDEEHKSILKNKTKVA